MSVARARSANPRLGAYFGVFASLFVALFVLALILSELGWNARLLQFSCLIVPFVLYAALGVASQSTDPAEYLGSGRRVPGVYNGIVTGMAALGGIFCIAVTGLFFTAGFDAWAFVIGGVAGLVVMGILFAPFVRKFGAYTAPAFIGRRLQSRGLRMMCAGVFIVPAFLLLVAELNLAVWLARKFTGSNERWMLAALLLTVGLPLVFGGMRAMTWSSTAQAIATLMAVVAGVGVLGAWFTYLPIPQLSVGPTLQTITATEQAYAVPRTVQETFASALPAHDLTPITTRMADPFTIMGPGTFVLTVLTMLAGIAAAPWLLPRCAVTTSVHASRKSLSWAVVVFGLIMVTAASGAVMLKFVVLSDVAGGSASSTPDWFQHYASRGLVSATSNLPQLPPSAIAVHRDAVAVMLPVAAGLPEILSYLFYVGALAAALCTISATGFAIATMLSEDVVFGSQWEPPTRLIRLLIGRLTVVGVLVLAALTSAVSRTDPLQMMLWAMAITGSTAFPLMVLTVWYKRLTPTAAAMLLIVGFVTAIVMIPATLFLVPNVPIVGIAPIGFVAAMTAGLVTTRLTGRPARGALEHVRDMRVPGGETIIDRENRLMRLKESR